MHSALMLGSWTWLPRLLDLGDLYALDLTAEMAAAVTPAMRTMSALSGTRPALACAQCRLLSGDAASLALTEFICAWDAIHLGVQGLK
jgi:hypothetical protein